MGTGIVSLSFELDGRVLISRLLLAVAAAAWIAFAAAAVHRSVPRRRSGFAAERSPAALTVVAATAVLGSRLLALGQRAFAVALLALAVAFWLRLSGPPFRKIRLPPVGSSFMLTVAPQSLAALAAAVAASTHASALLWLALGACLLGVAVYPFVLANFGVDELRVGAGDHWVAGGAVAISSLALGQLADSAARLRVAASLLHALHAAALVSWSIGVAWLVLLIAAEAASPRLHFDERRWSTVFPVGMYAASSFEVGRAAHISGIVAFADVWTWVALAVWLLTAAASLARARGRL
jgi:tellurite resistance protein TehA-like permease